MQKTAEVTMEILILFASIIVLPLVLLVAAAVILTSSIVGIYSAISSAIAPSIIGGILLLFVLGLLAYPFKNLIIQHEKTLDKWGKRIAITLFLICFAYHYLYVW